MSWNAVFANEIVQSSSYDIIPEFLIVPCYLVRSGVGPSRAGFSLPSPYREISWEKSWGALTTRE